jgi:PII-like signaling protein
VDTPEKIDSFLTEVEPMLRNVIVTTERAHVVMYRRNKENRS